MSNGASDSVVSTPAPPRTSAASARLPILTLVVACAAAALAVVAIATDDVGAPAGVSVAVQQTAGKPSPAQQPAAPGLTAPAVHRNVDGCGRVIVRGQDSCW